MKSLSKYLLIAVPVSGICACSQGNYMQIRRGTVSGSGTPSPAEVAALTRHAVDVDPQAAFRAVLTLLQSEGCLVINTDKASGLIFAQQMITDGSVLLSSMREIRTFSFLVLPQEKGCEVRLTIYIGYQGYSGGDSGSYYLEQLGMATDPELYRSWFAKIDDALKN